MCVHSSTNSWRPVPLDETVLQPFTSSTFFQEQIMALASCFPSKPYHLSAHRWQHNNFVLIDALMFPKVSVSYCSMKGTIEGLQCQTSLLDLLAASLSSCVVFCSSPSYMLALHSSILGLMHYQHVHPDFVPRLFLCHHEPSHLSASRRVPSRTANIHVSY